MKIGIMADSHGRYSMILAALDFFQAAGCGRVIHLGDICDSSDIGTADACVAVVKSRGVRAVKGNNDHQLIKAFEGGTAVPIDRGTWEYLSRLPLVIREEKAVFAHSRPFDTDLGLSCMVGTMGDAEITRFFAEFPATILFRGHGHVPALVSQGDRPPAFRPLPRQQALPLDPRRGHIVTCGALTHGFCLIWEPDANRLACISLPRLERKRPSRGD